MSFGEKIKELRTKKGMTQKALAEELSVTSQAVSRWENDEVEPSISTISQMAELFGCSIDELFGKTKVDSEAKEDNIIINVQDEKPKEEKIITVKTNIAICSKCNKPIYEQEEIRKWNFFEFHSRGRSTYREDKTEILCEECFNEKANEVRTVVEERKEEIDKGFKKKRIKSIVYMSLIMAVALFFGILIAIGAKGNKAVIITIFILMGLFVSIFVGSVVLGGTFLGDVWTAIASWGFVKFPGIIFSASADGIKFLIAMKLLFFILGIGFVLLAEAMATVICMALSIIAYPFSKNGPLTS